MDMLVELIQIICIAGILYGFYLSITYAGPAEMWDAYSKLTPAHFARAPLPVNEIRAMESRPDETLQQLEEQSRA